MVQQWPHPKKIVDNKKSLKFVRAFSISKNMVWISAATLIHIQPRVQITATTEKRANETISIDNNALPLSPPISNYSRQFPCIKGFRTLLAANAAISFALAFCEAENGEDEI
jgi:hypothetical protein